MSGTSRKSSFFKHIKRHRRAGDTGDDDSEGVELVELQAAQIGELEALHSPIDSNTEHIFDMQKAWR